MHPGSKLSFLIVGTGRSGTVYLARLLTGVGIPCSHERVFNGNDIDDAIRALEAPGGKNSECSRYFGLDEHTLPLAESSYMAVPFLLHPWLADAAIIHVVRDPL